MEKKIEISEKYLIFRSQARDLRVLILQEFVDSKNFRITLNFSNVNFISRSFADELLNFLSDFQEQKIAVKLKSLNPAVSNMLNIVENQKAKMRTGIAI